MSRNDDLFLLFGFFMHPGIRKYTSCFLNWKELEILKVWLQILGLWYILSNGNSILFLNDTKILVLVPCILNQFVVSHVYTCISFCCRGLKLLIVPLIAGLLEVNISYCTNFDAYFRHVNAICNKVILDVFDTSKCKMIKIYCDPSDK